MDSGGTGVPFLSVAPPAEKGIKLKPDSATIHRLLTEEQIALEKILTSLLAMRRTALSVTQVHKWFDH
jgi:hypothetical protein